MCLERQISRASAAVSSTIEKTTEPIRNTAAYKSLSDTIADALDDSGSSKHGGFEEKEARRKRRQLRLAKAGKDSMSRVRANPECVLIFFFQNTMISCHMNTERVRPWSSTRIHHDKRGGTS